MSAKTYMVNLFVTPVREVYWHSGDDLCREWPLDGAYGALPLGGVPVVWRNEVIPIMNVRGLSPRGPLVLSIGMTLFSLCRCFP